MAAAPVPGSRWTMTTDEQLILDFQQGSREAFNELFLRYREMVYAFFRRRVNQAAQAEELAQETFLGVLRAIERYEPRATFRAYLFGIAFKILAAHRRKAGHEENRAAVDATETPDPAIGDPHAALCVREAVQQLEPGEREVLMLREFEELSYDEIAGVLRLPVNTVRSRLFRARMALKEILARRSCEERI
jgi:RNA polymerase sigma-70 factor, ECF subfamily